MYATPTAEDYAKRWNECLNVLKPLITDVRTQEGRITLCDRVHVDWFGLHRDTGIRGNKYHRAIIDEAAHAPKLRDTDYYVIRPTLTDYKGDQYYLSTPKAGSYYNELMRTKATDPNWAIHQYPTSANPYIDAGEIEAARKELPSIIFRQEFLAEDVNIEGARIKREWLRYSDETSGEAVLGVDLAISQKDEADFSAFVVVVKYNDKYIVVEAVRGRYTFLEQQKMIISLASKWNARVEVEQVAYQQAMVQELVRTTNLSVRGVKVSKDKVSRFTVAEGKYEHGYLYHAKFANLREFEDEILSFPNGEHDDYCDALVHAINGHANTFNLTRIT